MEAASKADLYLVTAHDDLGKIVLLDVPASAKGVCGRECGLLDGTMASEVMFDDVGAVLACADMFGAMSSALRMTLEYARTRKQFGAAIGSFQVVQHYLVDRFIEIQQAESMVLMAGIKTDTDDLTIREHAASTAKAYLCKPAISVTQKAIQIHGGIGVTEELEIEHYFRRATRYAALYGDFDHHLSRLMKSNSNGVLLQ